MFWVGKYSSSDKMETNIIETERATMLNVEEQQAVSEDQKHSSNVARVHYQKLRSRDVALKGRKFKEKLRGRRGK